jgi:hypothetical protein
MDLRVAACQPRLRPWRCYRSTTKPPSRRSPRRSYNPDVPVAYTGGEDRDVNVTRRQVQIAVSVEILDQRQGKPLWKSNALLVKGDYDPGQEAEGRRKALDDLVVNIVEGAQSQW